MKETESLNGRNLCLENEFDENKLKNKSEKN